MILCNTKDVEKCKGVLKWGILYTYQTIRSQYSLLLEEIVFPSHARSHIQCQEVYHTHTYINAIL